MEPSDRHDRIPVEHLLDCVWRMDLDLRVTYVSPAAESMLGIPARVLIGSSLADHTTAEDLVRLREMVKSALSASDRTAGMVHETRIRHAEGHLVPLEVHSRLLLDAQGEPLELLGVARDISGRRERERRDRRSEQRRLETQKMEALARLAGGMVGDFQDLVEALKPDAAAIDPAVVAPLRERAAARVAELVTLAGRQELHCEDLDIDGHLARTVTELRPSLPPGVELIHRPGAGGSTVWADPAQIARALGALVRNAGRAVAAGGRITLVTGLRAGEPEPDAPVMAPPPTWVTVEVHDTGPGFDHPTRERILEPFFPTGPNREGFGLALVHGIATQHGGRLEVESKPGRGSTFRLLLPARFADEILATTPVANEDVASPTVLLVEDDPDTRNYCERVLRSGSYGVVSCADGAEALAVIAGGERVDAVVMDWALPGLDGRRVREQISRRRPDLPILVISGHASKDYEALGGVDSDTPWLAKPFTPPVLLAAVRSLLAERPEARGS